MKTLSRLLTIALFGLSSLSAFAGECKIVTKGWFCYSYQQRCWEGTMFLNTFNKAVVQRDSFSKCLETAHKYKQHYSGRRNSSGTIIVKKVKVVYQSENGTERTTLHADLSHLNANPDYYPSGSEI